MIEMVETIKTRVLVVDDNRAAAKMTSMAVRLEGHEVETAADGREAIEVAEEFRPDVIVMDIGMPRMNGNEAARHIRSEPWGADILLIALTGWGTDEDRQKTQAAGFNHHLVKPADPTELRRLLASAKNPPGGPQD